MSGRDLRDRDRDRDRDCDEDYFLGFQQDKGFQVAAKREPHRELSRVLHPREGSTSFPFSISVAHLSFCLRS